MHKEFIYEMARQVDCTYDVGLRTEMDYILENSSNIVEYTIEFAKNQYFIYIRVKQCDLDKTPQIFHSLLEFIEYSSVYYFRNEIPGGKDYLLFSQTESGKGFLCNIIFSVLV